MASPKASGSGTSRFRSLYLSKAPAKVPPAAGVVLLTGFGRFPGVERNASAELAAELARHGPLRHGDFRFVADVLPVDWREAPVRLSELLAQYHPAVAVHFGVSPRASGFVVETRAYNATKVAPDQGGQLAAGDLLIAGDRAHRSATLPVRGVVRALQAAGYPAQLSSDPGWYLCNAVLFHSLRYATRADPRIRSGFIHIPATLEPGTPGEPSLISWTDALEGGLRLMDICLAPLRARAAYLS